MKNASLSSLVAAASIACILPLATLSAAEPSTIKLESPMAGHTLHHGDVDMAVYYLDRTDHFEVVATYATRTGDYEPARIVFSLTDGGIVNVALPGHDDIAFEFSRQDETVTIGAFPVTSEATLQALK